MTWESSAAAKANEAKSRARNHMDCWSGGKQCLLNEWDCPMAPRVPHLCIEHLTGLLDSLPPGHPEKPGVVRAIELLRSES